MANTSTNTGNVTDTGTTSGAERVTAAHLLINSNDPSSPEKAIEESAFPLPLWEGAIAATRFGYGIRPGELRILAQDPRGWIRRQIDDISEPEELKGLSNSRDFLIGYMEAKRRGKTFLDNFMMEARQTAMFEISQHELLAYSTNNPFRERLVRFWMNQFNLSGQDAMMYPMALQFEREVIRPHLNRPYYQMLLAAYRHPAMLIYHDNESNITPHSAWGPNPGASLNESMAREILERHTMGPQGEYTEADIMSLAAMLSGYAVGGLNSKNPGRVVFHPNRHDANAKRFMRRVYPGAGTLEFEAALNDISRSPRTGWRIAERMAREFVSEEPSEALLQDMLKGFMRASGNVMGMADAMINSKHSWSPAAGKVKSPHNLVISTYRALDKTPSNGRELVRQQTMLGQPPYQAPAQTGWPTHSAHWVTPDLYADRLEWLTQMATENNLHLEAVDQGISVLGPRLRPSTARHMSVAPSNLDAVGMLLCSPEFQRV